MIKLFIGLSVYTFLLFPWATFAMSAATDLALFTTLISFSHNCSPEYLRLLCYNILISWYLNTAYKNILWINQRILKHGLYELSFSSFSHIDLRISFTIGPIESLLEIFSPLSITGLF